MPSGGLEIISDDGKTLFYIYADGDSIEIASGHICKHNDKPLDTPILIQPVATNRVFITRRVFREGDDNDT